MYLVNSVIANHRLPVVKCCWVHMIRFLNLALIYFSYLSLFCVVGSGGALLAAHLYRESSDVERLRP